MVKLNRKLWQTIQRALLIVIGLTALGSLGLPWYTQAIKQNDQLTGEASTGVVFYQFLYFYDIVSCPETSNTSCTVASFSKVFIGHVPTDSTGIFLWKLGGDPVIPRTRCTFLVSWIFELFVLVLLPLGTTKSTRSNIIITMIFVFSALAVCTFMIIPFAIDHDYESDCVSLVVDAGESPCNRFFYSKTISKKGENIEYYWGPTIGFFLAFANLTLTAALFLISLVIFPCNIKYLFSRQHHSLIDIDDEDEDFEFDFDNVPRASQEERFAAANLTLSKNDSLGADAFSKTDISGEDEPGDISVAVDAPPAKSSTEDSFFSF